MRTGRTRPVQTQKSSLLNIDFPRLRNALGDVDTDFISGKSVRRLSRLGDHMAMSQLFICIDNEADIVWFIDVFLIPKDLPNNVVGIGEGVSLTAEDRAEINTSFSTCSACDLVKTVDHPLAEEALQYIMGFIDPNA